MYHYWSCSIVAVILLAGGTASLSQAEDTDADLVVTDESQRESSDQAVEDEQQDDALSNDSGELGSTPSIFSDLYLDGNGGAWGVVYWSDASVQVFYCDQERSRCRYMDWD